VPDKESNAPLTVPNPAASLLRMSSPSLRAAVAADAAVIADVYNHFVHTTAITFEESAVPVEAMRGRIEEISSAGLPWVVLEAGGKLLGYAYASQWKVRAAYRFAVETAIGGIALPNAASVRLHERLGFNQVAHFKEVGFRLGRWVDVGYWQIVLQ
jgi:phosphinothricin acetyltransferase